MSAYIKTKYMGPTNSRGARIKASCKAGAVSISYAYGMDPKDNHIQAVKALIMKLGLAWGDSFAIGEDDDGCVFVPVWHCGENVITIKA